MTWKKAYLETRVLSADPVELVSILYEYAVLRVEEARTALADRDIAARSQAIVKAIAILGELETSLNHQLGGEIAFNLARLYRYMRDRLSLANAKQSDEPLAEVAGLLTTLGEAWQTIGAEKRQPRQDWSSLPMADTGSAYSSHAWSA